MEIKKEWQWMDGMVNSIWNEQMEIKKEWQWMDGMVNSISK